ncbi:branched-chain amino acid transport system ATP-binding protein [Bradyrhizobium japonicum]|jgi:branched-chain amino acid transport system ATP-binding protein|uniref:Branched-chain amino acid transport system ATP-binding protein n=2 Tax=Bradyrhizobium elkanii TaxID=29448 RepID=A0ABV4EXD0_BRAEL|nr:MULTISPECIES: ABC transporter ATP-binding protein [Bradyrhizobium]MBP2427679.1 branched-chain amino acid transport system ATP-binding protein [Bradyrhizobium elkanii]MCP1730097.1 branched-chain amino acid transport system ATP-binding protein [Bradyrhizobium elkanii]MCP1756839.1 branched-chain amino acid transport system ATP-binding protein [Bradyrhizobium elkanii]MCP1930552.1 branched-chain amino acid transport system ATP-binding protein [Bradyrhizobium elkanii]MCP1970877.1 branched-chain a
MALLDVNGLQIFYGDLQAVFDMNFTVADGEAVALVGANGAGKSTFLKALVGLNEERRGTVQFDGVDISQMPAEEVSRLGLIMVPEGRLLFDSLTIEENLLMGSVNRREGSWTLRRVFDLFPILEERRRMFPGQLSGGQQQMAAIGRALMSNPRLLLCDEISLGLAPVVVEQIYRSFADIRREGTAVVLVEQDVKRALATSERIYCLLKGRVSLTGPAQGLQPEQLTHAYFGN